MEGPSLVILKEEITSFKRKKIISVSGNTKIDLRRLANKNILDFKTWGKHFLLVFDTFFIRIHFLMFGSYRINERKDTQPRLSLQFARGKELNFYACAIKFEEGHPDDVYDWSADVMADAWDPAKARRKLRQQPNAIVSDALLNQDIFAGVGNIIKNEVLYRIKVHPATTLGELSPRKLRELVEEARTYSFDFYRWKKKYVLRKHWLVHTKKKCPSCDGIITKEYIGRTNRRTFFCVSCQDRL